MARQIAPGYGLFFACYIAFTVVAVLTVVASALVRVSDGVAMKEWMVLTLLGGQAE